MEKLFLAIERQTFSCTAWNSMKIPHWTETNLSALHFKTSLQSKRCHCFYLHLWLVLGKNTQPSMAIMTVYRGVFCILPLDNSITSLSTGWPSQPRQISVWVHVNHGNCSFFCGGVVKCQLFSQAKGNFERSWVKSTGCGQQSKTCLIKISSNNMNITGQCLQVIIRILSA